MQFFGYLTVSWLGGFRQEQWAERAVPARAARVELVLRQARIDQATGYEVSWLVGGCGVIAQRGWKARSEALGHALLVITNADLMDR